MTKSMAREKRPDHLDTEDHVTERVLDAAAWAETHRRAVIAGGIALVAVVAAAFYYQDYRQQVVERASVRLQEIQISSQSSDIEMIRSELRIFIDQYSGTSYSHQARVALGGLELRRDSLGLAIQALEPVADLGGGNPLSFAAMEMIAAAYEQGGDAERALQWYERFESDALFDYQRHFAVAEQARLHTIAGRYSEAAALYEALVDEVPDDPAGQEMYAVRLGEVRALDQFGAVPSAALPTAPTQAPGTENETDEAMDGEAIDVEPQGEGEEPGN
jgi:predicted negative regulator of RcsB-dependent stress response